MNAVSEYLRKRLNRRGDRAALARRLKISEATVTRWVLGQTEPGFENYIQIADYFEMDPRETFRLAGRPDFEELYNRAFPEFRKAHISEDDLYKNETHSHLHRRIQQLLQRGRIDKLESHIQLLEEEQALAESEQIFKWVFEQGPLGMTMTAPDYRFVKVNSTFCQMLGFSEAELTAMKFTEITYPEDLEGSVATAEKLFSGEMSFHHMEKRYLKKNGSPVWVSLTGCAIVDQDGDALYALGMTEDISERKSAEERLRDSEEKYRLLFQKSRYPAYITAENGKVIEVNEAARELAGISPKKLIGADVSSLLVHPACLTILQTQNRQLGPAVKEKLRGSAKRNHRKRFPRAARSS
jgi:PAS domain S-box-containing protein